MRRALVLILLASCASPQRTPDPSPSAEVWLSPKRQSHPLVGRIWSPARGRFVTREELRDAVRSADVVLLGEKHDNADHHHLQAGVLAMLIDSGVRPSVALEMVDVDQQDALDAYVNHPEATPAGVGHAVRWEQRGWPPWSIYAPIATVAFRARLPWVAANLPQDQVRALARGGQGGIPAEAWNALDLDEELPVELQDDLLRELADSHCGMLPEHALAPMALAQRAKDAQMSARVLQSVRPSVLIAGAGHVRTDRGVPWHLRRAEPDIKTVSISFREVDDATEPAAYAGPYDFIWFTPRVDEEDPCARFQMHKAP